MRTMYYVLPALGVLYGCTQDEAKHPTAQFIETIHEKNWIESRDERTGEIRAFPVIVYNHPKEGIASRLSPVYKNPERMFVLTQRIETNSWIPTGCEITYFDQGCNGLESTNPKDNVAYTTECTYEGGLFEGYSVGKSVTFATLKPSEQEQIQQGYMAAVTNAQGTLDKLRYR